MAKKYQGGPICIIGPPAVGKSTIGKKIAEKIGVPFFDIDELISKKAGMKTTKEVITKKGFSYFWDVENECLKETFQKDGDYVFALAGTICSPKNPYLKENQSLVRKNAFTICLLPSEDIDESVRIIWPRQHNEKRFTDKDSKELRLKIESKMPGYMNSADEIIYTHNSSIEKIFSVILKLL